MSFRIVIAVMLFLLIVSQSACAADRTFRGKVIDAETLKPIEGAVVVAIWRKTRAGIAGADTRFKDAKETLTDKNGEWTIVGPEGYEDKIIPGLLTLIGVWATQSPGFIIYKPGYAKYYKLGGFRAYPCVDKEHNIEGIVLIRLGDTKEEREKYRKKYGRFLPFIPVKDPERKLRDLDFSFEYPENVMKIGRGIYRKGIEPYWVYTVVGLKTAKTRKERLDTTPSPPTDDMGKLPFLYKLINQEHKKFGLKTYKRRAKK